MAENLSGRLTNKDWRCAYAAAADKLNALPNGSAMPPHPVASELGEKAGAQPPRDLKKAEFYAYSNATITEGVNIALTGEGRNTRFAFNLYNKPLTPQIAQETHLQAFVAGSLFFTLAKGMHTHATMRYSELCEEAVKRAYSPGVSLGSINRGDLPEEIMDFGVLTVPFLNEHSLTKDQPVEDRLAVAHDLSSILLSRASVNVSDSVDRPRLRTYINHVDMRQVGGRYQYVYLDTNDNGDRITSSISPGHGLGNPLGPTLQCPARPHLERYVAAGVNLLADAGYFHPDVPREMYEVTAYDPAAGRGYLPTIEPI